MKYEIKPNNDGTSRLVLYADEWDLKALRKLEDIHSDDAMVTYLAIFIAHTDLSWIRPEETGDLTDAPMLGIRQGPAGRMKITHRWAFMEYQVVSLLESLRDKGEAILIGE
jgi:hypothetical protein